MESNSDIFRSMVAAIEDYAILFLDRNGIIQNWNKGAENIKGYTAEEIVGKHFSIFYTQEDRNAHLPSFLLNQAIEKGKVQHEGWRVRKDGTLFWGNVIITKMLDQDNNFIGFTKITYDLTERKLQEKTLIAFNEDLELKVNERTFELYESEQVFRLLFENNPLPMWVFDLETYCFLDVNDIACIKYGYSRTEFMAMSVLDIRPDHQKDLFRQTDHSVSISPENYNRGAWQHIQKDGTLIDVEIFGHDIQYAGKNARIIVINDITNKKAAEAKLAASERKYRALVQNSYDAVCLYDREANILYRSESTERILGYTSDEVAGKNLLDYIFPEDLPEVKYKFEEVLTNPGLPVHGKYRLKHKSGYYLWCETVTTNLLHDNDIKAVVGNFRDITEEVISNEKLKNLNRMYAVLSEINQTIVRVQDEAMLFNDVCRIAVNLGKFDLAWIGLTHGNAGTSRLAAVYNGSQADLDEISSIKYQENGPIYRVLATGGTYFVNDIELSKEHTIVYQFARERNFRSFIVLPIKKEGVVYGTLNLFSKLEGLFDKDELRLLNELASDISFALSVLEKEKLRKASVVAVELSEANMRLILNLLPQSIFVKDHYGKYVFVNKTFAGLYKTTPEALLHKISYDEFPYKAEADTFQKEDLEVINSNKISIGNDVKFTDSTGETKLFKSLKLPFTPVFSSEVGVLGIAEDITEQRRSEWERNKMLADITERNKNLEQFTYIVSHNLRAPVANIMGLSSMLLSGDKPATEQEIMLNHLDTTVKKLDGVIKDLNEILQIKGDLKGRKETIRLANLVDDIRHSISDLLYEKQVTLTIDFSGVDRVLTVRSYLYSILYNLISNSIKFRQENVLPEISIECKAHGDRVEIIFTDNGMGIDLEQQSGKIFGLYNRFHQHIEGKGMGLFMVKAQVEALGGSITIESQLNKGTTFHIIL